MTNNSVRSDWDKKKAQEISRSWVSGVIVQAQAQGFYGKISLIFEDGQLKRAIKEESLKPPEVQ